VSTLALDFDLPTPSPAPLPVPLGETFDAEVDGARLGAQMRAVRDLMADGRWRTLRQISRAVQHPEASVSARLRDLRRAGWTVDRRSRGERTRGLWEYRATREG